MVNDAHAHMGFFPRLNAEEAFHYSPRRIFGALDRAGVGEFVVSSTDAVWDADGSAMHAAALEMKRLAGRRAHVFFWVSGAHLERNPDLELPDCYEGFKLHGGETAWLKRPKELERVLSVARERRFPVTIHTGLDGDGADAYLPFCLKFPQVKFDLAHGRPFGAVPEVMRRAPNVFTDTAFVAPEQVRAWIDSGADASRILFGTDVPAQLRYRKIGLTPLLRRLIAEIPLPEIADENFFRFLSR